MYDIEHSIGFLLSKGYQRAWAIMREEIESYDLTPPQFALLSFLWQQDGLTQVELSERGRLIVPPSGGLSTDWNETACLNAGNTRRIAGRTKFTLRSRGKIWKAP